MNAVVYLLQVSACMGIFYLFYYLLLSRYTFFTINRWYLLTTLAISFIIPLLTITVQHQEAYPQVIQQVVYINKLQVPQQAVITSEAPQQVQINWMALTELVYMLAVGALAIRLLLMVVKFFARVRNKRRTKIGSVHIVTGDEQIRNGSFFNFIFLNDDELSAEELEQIIAHEMLHVKLYHSVDRILAKVAQVFLWFNPFVYLYAKAIEENHEFEVDRAVSNSTDRNKYAELLFHLSVARQGTLYHSFSMVPLKKRITMLFTKPTNRIKKVIYLLVVPVVLMSCLAFARLKNDETMNAKKPVIGNRLADSSKVKYRQKIKRTPEQEKQAAEAKSKWQAYMQSDDYKAKDGFFKKIAGKEITVVVEGIKTKTTNQTENSGFDLNYNGEKLFLRTGYGQEKQLNNLLKVGDKISLKVFGGSINPEGAIGIIPASITVNGKKIFQLFEADKIPVYPYLYEANKVRFTDGQITHITKYANGKWKTAVLERVNGYKFNLSFKPNAPNLNSIKWGDHVTFRFVHEVKTGEKTFAVKDWVAITTNIKDYGIKNPDWFNKFYEVVKADTGKVSAIGGLERLGANPLVLIDDVAYNKDILYKMSRNGVKSSASYLPQYAVEKYGEKAKDGAVIINTVNGKINYPTDIERQNLIKVQAAKGKFFSRITLTKEDGSKYDMARITRVSGFGAGASLATTGKIAFIINNKLYNEAQFRQLFKEDDASYGPAIGVGGASKALVERGFSLDGYDLVFEFDPGAKTKANTEPMKTGAVTPQIKTWKSGTYNGGKPAVITGGSSDYFGNNIRSFVVVPSGSKKSNLFKGFGLNSPSKAVSQFNLNGSKTDEEYKGSDKKSTPAGKDTVGAAQTVNALKQTLAQIKGIEVKADGTVWVNNNPVSKLKINGKEYSEAEVKQAINTLPAEEINKTYNYIEKKDLLNSVPIQKITYKNQNDSLVAARFAGEVVTVKDIMGSMFVIIKNGDYFASYANLKNVNVSKGQKINAGQVLGTAAFNSEENKIAAHFQLYQGQTRITEKAKQETIINNLEQLKLNMKPKPMDFYAYNLK